MRAQNDLGAFTDSTAGGSGSPAGLTVHPIVPSGSLTRHQILPERRHDWNDGSKNIPVPLSLGQLLCQFARLVAQFLCQPWVGLAVLLQLQCLALCFGGQLLLAHVQQTGGSDT